MQLFRHVKDEDGATVLPNGNIIDLETGEITQKEFKAYVE
jgi:hypothetical protein